MRCTVFALFILVAVGLLVGHPAEAEKPVTIGEHVKTKLETPHPYMSSGSAEAALTWVDEIVFPGATYISVHFAKMDLAEGDYVVVRSEDGAQAWTYTGHGRHDLGISPQGFFATHINGNAAVVELYTSGTSTSFGYAIDKYGRGYNNDEILDYWQRGLGEVMNLPIPRSWSESLCTTDDTEEAKCYQASEPDAYDKARAVVRLLYNGSAHCTGWLVGNAGHLMTNEHCIGSQTQLDAIDFEFMAEGADCATDCSSVLGCPGTIEASGGSLVQVDAALDFSLVIPDTSTGTGTDLPATYGFMKIRPTGAVLGERMYIVQYPAGWGKRFAMKSTYPGAPDNVDGLAHVGSLTETPCSGGPGDVGYWADTQGGSSGSPVLGYSDNKIIALHHCRGDASCASGNPSSDDFNRAVPIEAVVTALDGQGNVPPGALCDPFAGPANLGAVTNGDNRIDLTWDAVAGTVTYNVYREADGGCPQGTPELLVSGLTGTSYSDTTVSGGTIYTYVVTATKSADDCESGLSGCVSETATGACIRPPQFAGIETAINQGNTRCTVEIGWSTGTAYCGSGLSYNVYRSELAGFTPGPDSLVASCVTGTTWTDDMLDSHTEYHYVVRAEDDSGGGSGPCGNGNEDENVEELIAMATGPDTVFFNDDVEGGVGSWTTAAGPTDPGTTAWAIVDTDSHSTTHSWFAEDLSSLKDQIVQGTDVDLTGAPAGELAFWHRYDTEPGYDGGVLEYSVDAGASWHDILDGDGGSIPANPDRFLTNGYNSTLGTGYSNPLPGRSAWSGTITSWVQTEVDLTDFAGTTVRFRWRIGCDASVSRNGWWLDDITVLEGSACQNEVIFLDDFESGDTSAWSVVN